MVTRHIHPTGFGYVRISELPERERDLFVGWLYGKTRPLIEGIDSEDAAYSWDYARFYESTTGRILRWEFCPLC